MQKRIAIIMTCFNRKEKTLKCLGSLLADSEHNLQVYMVDDGSTDGTGDAVKASFPQVNVIRGDGNLFWNRGMHMAFSKAVEVGYDFYLWVNDDVEFDEGCVDKLVAAYYELSSNKKECIIVGPTLDSSRTQNTYGGFGPKKSIKPFNVERIYMGNEYKRCLIFHGNCVLIPKEVVEKIGVNDPYYQHGYGDADYSLMAAKAGCDCWLANFPVGVCDRHDESFIFMDSSLPIKKRFEVLHSRINKPIRDEIYFCKKFYGILWPYKCFSADLKIILSSMKYHVSMLFCRKRK